MKIVFLSLCGLIIAGRLAAFDAVRIPNLKMTWTADGKKDHVTWLSVDLSKNGKKFDGFVTEVSPIQADSRDIDGDPLSYNVDVFDSAKASLTGVVFTDHLVQFTIHYSGVFSKGSNQGIAYEATILPDSSGHWVVKAVGFVGGVAWAGQSRYTFSLMKTGGSMMLNCEWVPNKQSLN